MSLQNELYRGEGRGAITNDGCAVELYRLLPYRGELDIFDRLLARGSEILELGCGTGRLTEALLDAGHRVTAVDNSPEMLRHVRGDAEKVLANIEDLELQRRFDVALLASCLVNTPIDSMRRAQLSTCRRHLTAAGTLIFERFDPSWLRDVEPGAVGRLGEVAVAVEQVARDGELVSLSLRYSTHAEDWRQHFTAVVLDDGDVQHALTECGFGAVEWIDARWGWARACAS
jgi:SAM-dependent methyltransferase